MNRTWESGKEIVSVATPLVPGFLTGINLYLLLFSILSKFSSEGQRRSKITWKELETRAVVANVQEDDHSGQLREFKKSGAESVDTEKGQKKLSVCK